MADHSDTTPMLRKATGLLPGLVACLAVTAAAMALEALETALFGRAWLEGLVLAIVLGAIVRTAWKLPCTAQPGVRFAAMPLLEVAVVLLGASFGFGAVLNAGPVLILGIAGVVVVAIMASYTI